MHYFLTFSHEHELLLSSVNLFIDMTHRRKYKNHEYNLCEFC